MNDKNEKSVLLVEDDNFLIDILSHKFKSSGYRLGHAGDGETALKKAREEQPDIILLDIILPGINGYEILEQLKVDGNTQNIPVVFLTNLGHKKDKEKAQQLGAIDFIVKANHSLDEIVRRVDELVAEHT